MAKFKQKWKHSTIDKSSSKRKNTREYITWRNMHARCYKTNHPYYYRYGDRGIKVCEKWHDYDNFHNDMCPVPSGKQLDRIDGNGNYTPSNCRWATPKEQSRNRDYGHFITYQGKTKRLSEWAEKFNLSRVLLSDRLNKCGWSVEKALTFPIDSSKNGKIVTLTHNGETKNITEWSLVVGVDRNTIYQRIRYGWTIPQTLGYEKRPIIKRKVKKFTK